VPLLLTVQICVSNAPLKSYNKTCSIESTRRTEGVALRFCASGGCSIGDVGREDLEGPFPVL
jgi:hypothetical protein